MRQARRVEIARHRVARAAVEPVEVETAAVRRDEVGGGRAGAFGKDGRPGRIHRKYSGNGRERPRPWSVWRTARRPASPAPARPRLVSRWRSFSLIMRVVLIRVKIGRASCRERGWQYV